MTISILAHDPERKLIGCILVSKWPSAGGVVPYFRPGVGMVLVQNMADAQVAELILDEMSRGAHPQQAIAASSAKDMAASMRQIAAMDLKGRYYAFSGKKCIAPVAIAEAEEVVVMGHTLPDESLVETVLTAYSESTAETMPARLLDALESVSAQFSSGAHKPVAGCVQVYQTTYPRQRFYPVNLRIDYAEQPVLPQLRALFDMYLELERRDIGVVGI